MLFNFDLHYSYSSYNNITSIQNSLLRWDPSLSFNKWNLKMKVGLSPVVKTDGFKLYPNIQLQHKLTDTTWDLQAGWISQTKNSNYSQLITENPWIISPAQLAISTQEKQYIKLVVNASKNVEYGFGISLNNYVNLALFNKTPIVVYDYIYPPSMTYYSNRVNRGLEYMTIWEPNAHTIELEANLQYQWSDVFSIHNEFKYTQYNYIKQNEKPWGLIPVQFNAGFYWKMNDKLLMDGSVQVMSGIQSTQEGSSFLAKTIPTAAIINAGISYKLSIPWKLWLKANNILNNTYQRWAEYPSLGVQINAGVVYSFHK
jgi:outer membrane receptor protein involved in Fe transport